MGNPCKRGHSGERYVANKQCVECNLQRARGAFYSHPKLTRPTRPNFTPIVGLREYALSGLRADLIAMGLTPGEFR